MFKRQFCKPITAISLTISLTMAIAAPLIKPASVSAQLFPQQQPTRNNRNTNRDNRNRNNRIYSNVIIPAGARIPLEYDKEKVLVTREETIPLTLIVAANIRDRDRNTLIPYGTEIEGQIEPDPNRNGSRFVAQELVFADGTRQSIDALSDTVTRTETVRRGTDTDDIIKGAAIGGAAAAVLGEIFGDINIEEVLGGAALGALGGWILGRDRVELISIDPNQDLDITLESDLIVR